MRIKITIPRADPYRYAILLATSSPNTRFAPMPELDKTEWSNKNELYDRIDNLNVHPLIKDELQKFIGTAPVSDGKVPVFLPEEQEDRFTFTTAENYLELLILDAVIRYQPAER